jgi:hypothetical protein
LFRVHDIELALSDDARDKLRGKVVDLVDGKIMIHDKQT